MAVTHAPGPHLALVAPGTVLLLEDGAGDAAVLQELVRRGPTVEQVVDTLLVAGGGLTGMVGFVLLRAAVDGWVAVVRGGLVVRDGGGGVTRWSPGEPWTRGQHPGAVELGPDGATTRCALPLVDGAAMVAALHVAPDVAPPAPHRVRPGVPAEETRWPAADLATPPPTAPPVPAAPVVLAGVPVLLDGYDDLVGATSVGPPRLAATPPAPARDADHDGMTMARGEVAALLVPPAAQAVPEPAGPVVLAVACPQQHPNPPHAGVCRTCGLRVAGPARPVPRPVLGAVVLPTGGRIALERPLVVGRTPRAERVHGDDLPRMVPVPSPEQMVSGSHLEVRLDGWHVLAVDLASTNGTTLRRQGQPDRRLDAGQPQLLGSGDLLDLGDGVVLGFEDLP